MGRKPCCAKVGLNRGAWTSMEDEILTNYIKVHGEGKWRDLPGRAGLQRCGKSCRLRWLNYLRPDIKRGNITTDEEELIVRLYKLLGRRWSLIAGRLPGRTDNEIKNYWNTNLSNRVQGHKNAVTPKANDCNLLPEKLQANEHKVIRTKAVKCTCPVNVNIPFANYSLESKSENSTAKEEESKSPSSSAVENEENSTDLVMDFDINELLAPHALMSDFHEIQQVDENGKDIADNEDYAHDFSLYMGEFEFSSSTDEAKSELGTECPVYWTEFRSDNGMTCRDTELFPTTQTLDLHSLETYLNLEDELIN